MQKISFQRQMWRNLYHHLPIMQSIMSKNSCNTNLNMQCSGSQKSQNSLSIAEIICFFSSSKLQLKDEFKIEPRYAHKKNLDKPEKKIMSWKWIIIEHWNLKIFCFLCFLIVKLFSSINFGPPYDFSLICLSFFLCAYRASILNSSLVVT